MADRFLKFIPSEEAFWLLENKPNAFRLLTHIANTARRYNGGPDGLTIGQCHLQHWSKYKLTEREYRTAKEILCQRKIIKIIETNRTRQKSTTGSTTKSTLVELCSSSVYDINPETNDDRNDDRATTDRRLTDDKQERIRRDISNDISKEEEAQTSEAQPASPPRPRDPLVFNHEKLEFEGISEKDMSDWKVIYPQIDLKSEILRATQWLISNPSKAKKSLWRKFLTGWLQRTNDSIENKKAYQDASKITSRDKRTKNMDGTPIESLAERMF